MSVTAIILAAGKGTRMKSDKAKVLHEVCGRCMLSYVVDACRDAGCERMLVVVGHQADRVREALAGDDADITWVEQRPQLGTGHGVMVCGEHLGELSGPVLVLAGDGPLVRAETLRTLVDRHVETGAACTLATSILDDPGRYGRIIRDEGGKLSGIVEYLDADASQRAVREVNVSLYCFDADALRGVVERLDNDNAKGEYYLTDAIGLIEADGATLEAVAAVPPEDVLSINTAEQLERVERIMQRRLGGAGERNDT